jgi:fatty acid desaturase
MVQAMNNDAVYDNSPVTRKKVTDIFSKEEIARLRERSDLMGVWGIAATWAVIAGCFAAMGWAMQQAWFVALPVTLLAVAILGGRQLALAILTHEATHKTLFKTRWLNDWPTDWLCARPIGLDLEKYRQHHFIHHTKTGTPEDSDISLVAGLPTTRSSLRRKLLRDLSGRTGLKYLFGFFLMNAELMKWTVASDVEWLPRRRWWQHALAFVKNSAPTVLTNLVLAAVLMAFGHGELYLAWLAAYLIPYPLFLRIRAMAEHAATKDSTDMFENTRTTRAGFIARSFVAPFRVNFHIEHHVMPSVPYHRLPLMHRMLREKGVVAEPPGYWKVLDIVSSAPA